MNLRYLFYNRKKRIVSLLAGAIIAVGGGTAVINSGGGPNPPCGAPSDRGCGLIADVSSYQGHPDWATAKQYLRGGIAKAGEGNYGEDPSFQYNWHELRRVGLWHAAYWFLRDGGCQQQADQFWAILLAAGGLDSGPPIVDAETRMAPNCIPDFIGRLRALDHWNVVVLYASPGAFPGGNSLGALGWVATYGNSPGCLPFRGCRFVAWQYTGDGIGPSPHYVPGIGSNIDVSEDNGLTKITHVGPAPPRYRCFGPGAQIHVPLCGIVRPQVARFTQDIAYVRRRLNETGCRKNGKAVQPVKPYCLGFFRLGDYAHAYIDAALRGIVVG